MPLSLNSYRWCFFLLLLLLKFDVVMHACGSLPLRLILLEFPLDWHTLSAAHPNRQWSCVERKQKNLCFVR